MSLFKSDALTESSMHEYGEDTDPTVHFSTMRLPPEETTAAEEPQPAPLFSAPPPLMPIETTPTEEATASEEEYSAYKPAPLFQTPTPPMNTTHSNPAPAITEHNTPNHSVSTPPTTPPYGIEKIIRLMRTSPAQDSELVISIIIKTLESAGIDTQAVLVDAAAKEEQAHTAIQKLEKEIQFLETQMLERRQQIDSLSGLLTEFTLIKGKIEQATHHD